MANFVQIVGNDSHTASSVSSQNITPTVNTTKGNTLLIVVKLSGGILATGGSDTQGNTYVVDAHSSASGATCSVVRAVLTTAVTTLDTITINYGSATNGNIVQVYEYKGILTASPVDVSVTNQGVSVSSLSSGNLTTTNIADLLISAFAINQDIALTTPTNFTNQGEFGGGAATNRVALADRVPGATLTTSATWSWTGSWNAGTCLIAYKVNSRTIVDAGGNWSAAGTWLEGVVPTATDDVVATATSGNLTLDATGNCQSVDFTNYGTHTFAMGTQTLNIGSASGGKLLLLSTMTFSFTGNGATNQINFVATTTNGGVGWPITTGTQTIPVCNFSGIGGAWTFQDDFNVTVGASGTLTHTAGTLNCNNKNWSAWSFSTGNSTKVLNMGSGTFSGKSSGGAAPWNATGTNTTINAQTSIIDCTGAGTNIFQGGSKTYNTVKFSAGGNKSINGTNVFANLTFTGSAGKTDSLSLSSNQTVTGILTLAGNSAINRALVQSTTIGTQMTITNTGATQTWSNVDFQDIALSTLFDASAITGNSGDCGGNSNITFTTPASQTHTASAGGNWSDVTKWTSRVPLPQDPVIIDSNTTGTITADMPRLGASINFTGFAGTWSCPTTFGANGLNIYGSLTLVNTMTRTGNGQWFFCGRGTHTLTTAGLSSVGSVTFRAFGGSYSMQDAWNELADITVQDGTFNLNGFDLTCTQFVAQSGRTTVINPGTNTITVTSTANAVVFNVNTANTTFNGSAATIVVSTASTNLRSVSFKNGTSIGTITYTVAGSTGTLGLFGAAAGTITLNTINVADGRGLQIQSGMFWNITNWNVNGVAGSLITLNASTGGVAATLTKSGGTLSSDYITVQDITGAGTIPLYAGAHGSLISNTTNWLATAPPSGTPNLMMMGVG